jgi:geranylgeranyl diphosphate synthase type I
MDIKERLAGFRAKLNPALQSFFEGRKQKYSNIADCVDISIDIFADLTLRGGKRLRPALLFFSYKMFGGDNEEEALQFSMFVEILQSFLLIHDDICDNDDLRRGKITVHKFFEKVAPEFNSEDDFAFGNVMGILNGDLGAQFANEIVMESDFPAEIKVAVGKELSRLISKVIVGQILDYVYPHNKDMTWNDLKQIHTYKTAAYTYELPVIAGSLLAGNNDESVHNKLRLFSEQAGVAFQLRDDILGLFGTEEKLGKNIASDVEEGKKTLLVMYAIENGNEAQKSVINNLLGRDKITREELENFRQVVRDTGSLDYCQDMCEKFSRDAQEIFRDIEYKDKEGWQFIYDVVEYMSIRLN